MDDETLAGKSIWFREAYEAGRAVGNSPRCRQWEAAASEMATKAAESAASMPAVEVAFDGLSSGEAFRSDTEVSWTRRDAAEGFAAAAAELEAAGR